MGRSRFDACRAKGVVVVDTEFDRSRFSLGAGVVTEDAAGVLFAEPGRGGGCMGVCFDVEAREDAALASVGV